MIPSFALLLGGCTPDPTPAPEDTDPPVEEAVPCPEGRTLVLGVTGAVGASEDAVAGLLDAATWRLGDAVPLTTTSARDGGSFTLCLVTDPVAVRLYEQAFFAAWIDADDDGRLDAATEPLCDRAEGGSLLEELYFEQGEWRVGLSGTPGGSLSPAADLSGDRCSR